MHGAVRLHARVLRLIPFRGATALTASAHLHLGEGFEHVALLDVVEIDERDTALEVGGHLLHIVLVTLEGSNVGSVHHDTVADDTRPVAAMHLTLGDHTAGNGAHLRNLIYLAHLYDR